jgi:hypothetical protein
MLSSWPPESGDREWTSFIQEVGLAWREDTLKGRVPAKIRDWWRTVLEHSQISLDDSAKFPGLTEALLQITAAADEACAGVGIPSDGSGNNDFALKAGMQLISTNKSSLCRSVDSKKCRVLPKMHSPNSGLTVRSLSHHLAFVTGDEMKPVWNYTPYNIERKRLSLLLLPWPVKVQGSDFRIAKSGSGRVRNMRSEVGLFSYAPDDPGPGVRDVLGVLSRVRRKYPEIDGVILPETSVSWQVGAELRKRIPEQNVFLITGVRSKHETGADSNSVHISFPVIHSYSTEYVQSKHHRWKLDENQVKRYGMSELAGKPHWWEDIDISNRTLNLFAMKPWLTMTVLVCEDLARPEPVGDLIRAVGPNLVIALLMDGPQVETRWPARHAMVLTDDPGCSVLTLSCLGMTKLGSDPARGPRSARAVALWRDPTGKSATRIVLPARGSAIILRIEAEEREEFTADGRSDRGTTGYPKLTSYILLTRSGNLLKEIIIN